MSNRTVERLSALTVLSPQGEEVPLASLWERQPVVLALIRHFG
jgi:hypothetical protein